MSNSQQSQNTSEIQMSDSAVQRKLSPFWRWCIALLSLFVALFEYVGYEAARAINGYYFKDYSPSFGYFDLCLTVLAAYLFLVSVFGRWRLFIRSRGAS